MGGALQKLCNIKKNTVKYLVIIILTAITACSEKAKSVSDNQTEKPKTEFQIPDSTYVILDFKSDWYWIFNDVKPATISKTELAEIEKIIRIAIKENNELQLKNLEEHNKNYPDNKWTETGFELKLDDFKRQFVPVINEEGQKEVWINFFCDDWGNENWKTDIMIVQDGGNCYFNIKVNLETKTYSELRINGYA